jgi:histidinol-phosphate aminotransferase
VMYAISARQLGLEFIGVDLKSDFSLDLPAMLAAIEQHQPTLVYLAYPNNPTGNLFDSAAILQIIKAAPGLVVLDEAYQPFNDASFMPRLPEFANLVVMRTVSKLGLAGIRLGYMSAHPALLHEVDKVRPPYNINVLTQACAEFLLDYPAVFAAQAAQIREARSQLTASLQQMGVHVFPSAANFVLIRLENAEQVHQKLLENKILVKNVGKMHALLHNCLRITVSTPDENQQFLHALARILA